MEVGYSHFQDSIWVGREDSKVKVQGICSAENYFHGTKLFNAMAWGLAKRKDMSLSH
jgi:hypothetical protein